jgi:hypothetical protein
MLTSWWNSVDRFSEGLTSYGAMAKVFREKQYSLLACEVVRPRAAVAVHVRERF